MYCQLKDISFQYDEQPIIHHFSMSIEKGTITAILGQSGRGKSTLLRILSGLERPSEGVMVLDQETIIDQNTYVESSKREVSLVFQDYALFPHMTVYQNIAYGIRRLNRKDKHRMISDLLEATQLTAFSKRYPSQLSGGQQQRVALARALAFSPKLLCLDEPFSNLDSELKADLRVWMKAWFKKQGITVVLVTHDKEDALLMADQIIDMDA